MIALSKGREGTNAGQEAQKSDADGEDIEQGPIFSDRLQLQEMTWEVGRILQLIGLGPLAWAGAAAGITLPSLQGLLWAGVLLPAITSLIGLLIEKGVEYSQDV